MILRLIKLSAILVFLISQLFSQVIITEVMYDLDGSDSPNEYIELFNTSNTTYDLTNWTISDRYSTDDITDAGNGLLLLPLSYAIIMEGDYIEATGIYNGIIPPTALIIKVDDSSIGNSLSTSDSLYLNDDSNLTLDSYAWTDIAPDGFSLEKIRLEQPNTSNNWKASKDSLGTPGKPNSVLPLAVDGEIVTASTTVNPTIIDITETTQVNVEIRNIGLNVFSGSVIVEQSGTEVGSQSFSNLAALSSTTVLIDAGVLSSGEVVLDIFLVIANDMDESNNADSAIISVTYAPGTMTLNEYHSQPVDDQIEFVEILHRGLNEINMENWRIADSRDGTNYRLPIEIIQSNGFIIIAPDSSMYSLTPVGTHYLIPSGGMPALNNSGDAIRLFDPYGTLIDSLTFDSSWNNVSGISTEKILPEMDSDISTNWKNSVSQNLMTPGLPNSVIPYNIDGSILDNITISPPYPKKGDNIVATVPVQNVGIQNINGTLIATLYNNIIGTTSIPLLSMGEVANIYINLSNLPSGRHDIQFNIEVAGDENISNNTAYKKVGVSFDYGVVKINEFLVEPSEYQIEFIELVVERSIVIDGWRIADRSSSNLLPITYLEKGDYIVIASDTSLKLVSNPDAKYLIPYGGLPTLNNSGDNIYLFDMNHTIIDSLEYGSGWPVIADTSTEKLRPNLISNDPLNWKNSTDNIGMTPGYINSNYLIEYDGEIIADSIYSTPTFPKNTEPITLNIPITNHGAEPIFGNLNIFDQNDSIIESYTVTNIARRDTVVFVYNLQEMQSGIHPIKIQLDIENDSNLNNNIVNDTIYVSYDFGDVLINEFLAGPNSTQAEFIELISFKNIDLINWSIEDATNNPKYFDGGIIPVDEYLVLSEDLAFGSIIPAEATFIEVEDFPSLNNYGDAIYLKDFTGTIIDSLIYTTWWKLQTGTSTEKIHPELISADSSGWKLSSDSTGMTPGRTNSVTAKNIDGVILTDMVFNIPEYPDNFEDFKLTIPITNHGLNNISGDLNIEYGDEILANITVNNIALGDTMFYHLNMHPLPSGIHRVGIRLVIDNDENLDNNYMNYYVRVSYEFGDVMINEFLADPESPLSEFVELYTFEDIDFMEWGISDNRKNSVLFGNETIEQDNYVVLSEDVNLTTMIPIESTLFEVNSFPSLNNSGDGIFIYDFTGKIIDSLNYTNADWPMDGGISTEKLFPNYLSNDATRWKESTNPTGSTIGRINSVILQNVNGTILPYITTHYPEFPHPSESIAFTIAIQNTGIDDINGEVSVQQNNSVVGLATFSNLKSNDSTFVSFNIEPLQSGNNQLELILDVAGDMNTSDNQMDYNIYVSYPFGTVVINEFLAKPDTTQAEFVEIISFSDIDLTNWSISDNTFKPYYFGEKFASANQPIVVTSDSLFATSFQNGTSFIVPNNGWPTLNNESDGILLYDATGAIIDSLSYNSDWPIADARSTEKYRPDFESYDLNRWGIAVNAEAMTPGQENSLYFDELPDKGTLEFDANPFSPNGDGIDDELLIKYKLPFEQGIIKLQIFDMTGREIATPYWNVYFPQEGILKWDGKRDNGNVARIGIYIIKLSAKDPSSSNTWEKVKTVVLAKQL